MDLFYIKKETQLLKQCNFCLSEMNEMLLLYSSCVCNFHKTAPSLRGLFGKLSLLYCDSKGSKKK